MFDFFKSLFRPEKPSSTTARERLRLVLLSDHISLSPATIESLKADLLAVISRYVEIDPGSADVTFEHREHEIAMLASVPIKGLRDGRPEPPPSGRSSRPAPAAVEALSAVTDAEPEPETAARAEAESGQEAALFAESEPEPQAAPLAESEADAHATLLADAESEAEPLLRAQVEPQPAQPVAGVPVEGGGPYPPADDVEAQRWRQAARAAWLQPKLGGPTLDSRPQA